MTETKHPTFDKDGYPTDETLSIIETWNFRDFDGLVDYVTEAWSDYGTAYIHEAEGKYIELQLTTGGWSGNESIIMAMERNLAWWGLHWFQSTRGGKHNFLRRTT